MISKFDSDEEGFCRSIAMSELDPFEIEPAVPISSPNSGIKVSRSFVRNECGTGRDNTGTDS